jgi:hypothetical protein
MPGQEDKTLNHKGHEGTQRRTLRIFDISSIMTIQPGHQQPALMLTRRGAIRDAAVGAAIAVIMISLDNVNLGQISIPLSSFIDRAVFTVCPFYSLGFSGAVKSETTLLLITILGNNLLYGLLGMLIAAGVFVFRKARP